MRALFSLLMVCSLLAAGPTAQAPPDAARITELEQQVARYLRLLADWGGLTRYGSADAELGAPAPGERRVVFIGDDVTAAWNGGGRFFPGKSYLNRGIARQTTPQMLVRFRQDVIALKPAVVVIQGGTNDVAGINGPGTRGTLSDNLMSMTELAQANGIHVVIASILPICDCVRDQSSIRSSARIADFNDWIRTYTASKGAFYLDYYAALAEGRTFKAALTSDGFLPNDAGYQVMAPLAEQAIAAALAAATR
ncbi:MAG: GDSL-type esterase/lipase family protein [Vicinamibacterales bacterium]